MSLLTYSDLAAGASMGVFAWVHQQRNIPKLAGYSVLSSVAGRYVSQWLNGNPSIDYYVTPAAKDYLIVAVCRYLIGMVTKEQALPIRCYDTVLNDVIGAELLKMMNVSDRALLGGVSIATPGGNSTAPVVDSNSVARR